MLDIHLADALIRAVPRSAQLVIIGDVDQLPSVGPGAVLADLILSQQIACKKSLIKFSGNRRRPQLYVQRTVLIAVSYPNLICFRIAALLR